MSPDFTTERRGGKTAIEQIAEAVGMPAAVTLRQHFSRALGTTPTAYRRRFRLR